MTVSVRLGDCGHCDQVSAFRARKFLADSLFFRKQDMATVMIGAFEGKHVLAHFLLHGATRLESPGRFFCDGYVTTIVDSHSKTIAVAHGTKKIPACVGSAAFSASSTHVK